MFLRRDRKGRPGSQPTGNPHGLAGANDRAARRAKSPADLIHKLGIVEEEADESSYCLELLVESGLVSAAKLGDLMKECDEITAIVAASINTAKRNRA